MQIAYYAHVNDARRSGVLLKIAGQIREWRAAGHDVRLFVLTRDTDDPWTEAIGDVVIARYAGALARIRAVATLVGAIRAYKPKLVYMRWELFYPPLVLLPVRVPLVLEINTDDKGEDAWAGRGRRAYQMLTRWILMRKARAFVFVTSELSKSESFKGFKARHRVVTNGVDLDAYPILPAATGSEPRLVFVGTAGQPWHGVDKLLKFAPLRPDWQFDIVGMDSDIMDPDAAVPPNLVFHGALDRAGVVEKLAAADVGIGTLALHRKAMDEACPLKVREYLAMGLPVLYGYEDPDADGLSPYTLRIPNTETNLTDAIDAIDAFVTRSRGVRIPREAVAHIDIRVKEEQRMALFDELVRK